MSDKVPGLEEEGPKLTQHSGLAVSRRGEGGGGMDLPPRESPLLRSVRDIYIVYIYTCMYIQCEFFHTIHMYFHCTCEHSTIRSIYIVYDFTCTCTSTYI